MSKLFVDWISGVLPHETMNLDLGTAALLSDANRFAVNNLHDGRLTPVIPRFGYAQAWRTALGGTIQYHPSRPEMGVNVVYSGKALAAHDWRSVLALMAGRGHIARLDVTIDVIDDAFDLEGLYTEITSGNVVTHARHVSYLTSTTGSTLYVGRRSSDRMLRIYDKGGEQGDILGVHWRIEAELKGVVATSVGKRLLANTDEGYGVFKGILDCPSHRGYSGAVGGATAMFDFQTDKRSKDTEAWLFGLVARTMARQERLKPGTLDAFKKLVTSLL